MASGEEVELAGNWCEHSSRLVRRGEGYLCGPLCDVGDSVHVEGRRVGGQDGVGRAHTVQHTEDICTRTHRGHTHESQRP
jgi:hypothetical protein